MVAAYRDGSDAGRHRSTRAPWNQAAEADNTGQRKQVEYVLANTRPDEPVFDGYTGHGVFRPHAYFYWFLHQEIQAMLPESDKSVRLIAALEARRPAMAIADNWVATLPMEVQTYLANHYEGTTPFAELKRGAGPTPV